MGAKMTWSEKLASSKPHEVKPVRTALAGMKKGEIMLVPSAKIIDDFIRTIPLGKSVDVNTLRRKLSRKYRAEVTCPIATGFQLRTVAEAAYEAHKKGAGLSAITPVWRVLDEHTPTTKKLSCGAGFILKQRVREGLRGSPADLA